MRRKMHTGYRYTSPNLSNCPFTCLPVCVAVCCWLSVVRIVPICLWCPTIDKLAAYKKDWKYLNDSVYFQKESTPPQTKQEIAELLLSPSSLSPRKWLRFSKNKFCLKTTRKRRSLGKDKRGGGFWEPPGWLKKAMDRTRKLLLGQMRCQSKGQSAVDILTSGYPCYLWM